MRNAPPTTYGKSRSRTPLASPRPEREFQRASVCGEVSGIPCGDHENAVEHAGVSWCKIYVVKNSEKQ